MQKLVRKEKTTNQLTLVVAPRNMFERAINTRTTIENKFKKGERGSMSSNY